MPAAPDQPGRKLTRRAVLQGAAAVAAAGAAAPLMATPAHAHEGGPLPPDSLLRTYLTPAGTEYAVLGSWPDGPSRILLTATRDNSDMTVPYYTQAAIYLRRLGYIVVHIDLPSHGKQVIDPVNDVGLNGWVWRLRNGMDFVKEYNKRMHDVVSHLIATGRTQPGMLAMQGTSRGGFLAYHYAIYDDRVRCALGFAPITDLAATPWFAPIADNSLLKELTLTNPDHVTDIMGIPHFLVIGDADNLVSNRAAHLWSQSVSDAAHSAGVAREIAFHQLSERRGHTTPAGGQLLAATWILRVMQGMTPEEAFATAAVNRMTW